MNLGIIVPHLGASQIAYESISLANSIENVVVFFEQLVTPCIPIKCATMCINELPTFRGTLITSNIDNTLMARKMVNPQLVKIIFYVWDLEWLRPHHQNYLYNLQAYNTADILMARHKEHVGPIENYCNRKPMYSEFKKVIQC